jgi:hypothetical protein
MVDINNLRKQAQQAGQPYRAPALATLTPDQKAKLQTLSDALKLAVPAGQAVTLNLIDTASGSSPIPPPIGIVPLGGR